MAGRDGMTGLRGLATLREGRSGRASSWDRRGGNKDNLTIWPRETAVLAEIEGAGTLTHLWCTVAGGDPFLLRVLVLRIYWDGAEHPSVEVPLGDFFGVGNCLTANYQSQPLAMSPQDGMGFSCWFPMPFAAGARITLENESDIPCLAFYYYIDYEQYPQLDAGLGRFHATWHREAPCTAVEHPPETERFGWRGFNLTGEDNYVLLETAGRGHYVGCNLHVYNTAGKWYGEGDDMIFVDGEAWPPALHGTGTEDYFGGAWCPEVPYAGPYIGLPLAGMPDWLGYTSMYRYHIEDPVLFQKSIRVTIEHGHANDRGDDYSSVAYWYQDRAVPLRRPLPAAPDRLPPLNAEWSQRAGVVRGHALALTEAGQREGATRDERFEAYGRLFQLFNAWQRGFVRQDPATLDQLLDGFQV